MLSSSSLAVLLLASASVCVDARRNFAETFKLAEADRAAVAQKISFHNAALAKRLASGYTPPQARKRSSDTLLAKRASGEADVALTLIVSAGLDSSYYGNITVGEGDSATGFAVITDTGSAGALLSTAAPSRSRSNHLVPPFFFLQTCGYQPQAQVIHLHTTVRPPRPVMILMKA